ncbi:MAG: FAD:protein FMN transferase [Armatimonadetes bacterium]|nr:FAD:protein FMN transferase [Armatimonadota bacterium]
MMPDPADTLEVSRYCMRTRFEIVMRGASAQRLRAAGEAALDEVSRIETALSFYDPASDISRLNSRAAREAVRVDPRLLHLLETAKRIWTETGGAFDVTVGPLMRAWGFTSGSGRAADEDAVHSALEVTGMDKLLLDEAGMSVRYRREGVQVDLGAIGKGFAVDAAVGTLRECGVSSALVHGGTSSVYALGAGLGEEPWPVSLRNPRNADAPLAEVRLQDVSLSVSASHGKSFVQDGQEMGHVLDPRSGRPAVGALVAAVIGPSATEGDALSTALLVLGEEGLRMLERVDPDLCGLVALRDGRVVTRGDAWMAH